MSEPSKIIVAIDIGTTKICAIAGRKNEFGKLEILGIGQSPSRGVHRGMVANIDKTVESIKNAVEQLKEQVDIEIEDVYVGIAGDHIKSQQHRGNLVRSNNEDEISKKDIATLKNQMYKMPVAQGNQIIHVIPQEFIVDGEHHIKDPEGYPGTNLEANFHIITGDVTAARNIIRCIEKCNMKVADLILEPIASAASVLSEEEKDAGVVLVDIGGGTSDITIFKDGIIKHTAVIPFGGEIITNDIKNGCVLLRDHAEKLKVRFGSAMVLDEYENKVVSIPSLRGRAAKEISLGFLAQIINARTEEIIRFVSYEISKTEKDYLKSLIGGIVLTGGGSMLKHLKHQFELETGMDVKIGLPIEHLAKSDVKNIQNPIYSTGIGLVMKGFEYFESDLSMEEETDKVAEEVHVMANGMEAESGKGLKKYWTRFRKWFEDGIENEF